MGEEGASFASIGKAWTACEQGSRPGARTARPRITLPASAPAQPRDRAAHGAAGRCIDGKS